MALHVLTNATFITRDIKTGKRYRHTMTKNGSKVELIEQIDTVIHSGLVNTLQTTDAYDSDSMSVFQFLRNSIPEFSE